VRQFLRLSLSFLLVAAAAPFAHADQAGAAASANDLRMPFEKGTVEISVLGGATIPTSLFRSNPDHQLAMASFAIGRVMAGSRGKGSLELLVDVTPFFQVRQPDVVRGWATAPLFIRWNFPALGGGPARIYGEVSGSLLFTTAPVPAVRRPLTSWIKRASVSASRKAVDVRGWSGIAFSTSPTGVG
jgi:hypothetical protein